MTAGADGKETPWFHAMWLRLRADPDTFLSSAIFGGQGVVCSSRNSLSHTHTQTHTLPWSFVLFQLMCWFPVRVPRSLSFFFFFSHFQTSFNRSLSLCIHLPSPSSCHYCSLFSVSNLHPFQLWSSITNSVSLCVSVDGFEVLQ